MRPLLGAGGGAVLTAFFAGGWIVGVVLIATILVVVGATCWIVSDRDRPQRLAIVLKALRPGAPEPPTTQLPPGDPPDRQDPQPEGFRPSDPSA